MQAATDGDHPSVPAAARVAMIAYAAMLFVAMVGLLLRHPWATSLWPFSYTAPMSYTFIASILAAAGASIMWCAVAREYRALVGVGIDAFVITAPAAVYALMLGRRSLYPFAAAAALTAMAGLAVAIWCRRYRFRDRRRTPAVVRWSFVGFVLALLGLGGAMASGNQRILPWDASREVTVLYGWIFLGASSYFLYGLVEARRSNATGQLLAFLAYDLVLIVPFIRFFGEVRPEKWLNHVVYTAVVVYSGLLAVFYCFVLNRSAPASAATR